MNMRTCQSTLDLHIYGLGGGENYIGNNKGDAQNHPAQKMPVSAREIRKLEGDDDLRGPDTSREK